MSEIFSFVESLWESNPRKPEAADRKPDEPDPSNQIDVINPEMQRPLVHGVNEIFPHKAPVLIMTPVCFSPKRLQTPGRASHRCDEKCLEAAAQNFFTCARAFDLEQRPRVLHIQPVCLIAGLIWIVHASVHVFAFVRMFPRRLTPPFPSLPATLRCSSQK